MEIHLAGSRPTRRAPPEYFTGTVLQDPIIQTEAPARLASTRVSFEPGARTAWHTHPLGQTLYVISGVGRVQAKGGPIREIRPGDVVWIPPGEKHWHGASPTNAMTHIAMQEAARRQLRHLDGACDRRGVFGESRLKVDEKEPGYCSDAAGLCRGVPAIKKSSLAKCDPIHTRSD